MGWALSVSVSALQQHTVGQTRQRSCRNTEQEVGWGGRGPKVNPVWGGGGSEKSRVRRQNDDSSLKRQTGAMEKGKETEKWPARVGSGIAGGEIEGRSAWLVWSRLAGGRGGQRPGVSHLVTVAQRSPAWAKS